MQKDIDKQIESVMASLDGMHRAEANPFLYTRIRARLASRNSALDKLISITGKPAFAFAVLIIVIATNVSVFLQSNGGTDQPVEQAQLAVADQYSNNISTLYEYENTEP